MNLSALQRLKTGGSGTAIGIVYVLYALSGFLSLGYQVAWFRIYVDRFGSTNLTFIVVLCSFIGGLGAGALVSRRLVRFLSSVSGIADNLRLYGLVEVLVAGGVLLTFLAGLIPADVWGNFPYAQRGNIYVQTSFYQASKLAIATACVLVPCFFMGVTFPLLCRAFDRDGRFPSALYAWNTLGACAGVLVCQFVLLRWLGQDRMLWLLAGLNLVLGLAFLLFARAPDREISAPAVGPDARSGGAGVLLTCAVLSGLLSGALEGDMFKRIGFAIGSSHAVMSFISFWAILGIFTGSWAVRSFVAIRLVHIKVAFLLAVILYGLAWRYAYDLQRHLIRLAHAEVISAMQAGTGSVSAAEFDFPTSLLQLLVYVGAFVFPAFFCVSLLLPYVCNRLQADRRHLGIAYGANTVAFCLGMVGFTWLAPRINIFYSMRLMTWLLVVGVGLLVLISERRRLAIWKPAVALIAFAIACGATPAGFDRNAVMSHTPAAMRPVRALKSNGAHTTYVVSRTDGDALYFNNYSMSATGLRAQIYMRLMAQFPLLAQAEPRSALLICFGVGNTAAAIAAHESIESIDIVDLNDKVFATAPEFAATNDRVHADARVRLIHDDGRNYLNVTDRKYDLVTSEPPPPMMAGVYRLYSKQYYERVLDRLNPDGMMTQWLPVYQMPHEAVDLAVSTFIDVLPHALIFTGADEDFILVGGRKPVDFARLERRFTKSSGATTDLSRLRVTRPAALVARVVKTDRMLREQYDGRPVISDQRNDLAYLFMHPTDRAVITYDPLIVLDDIGAARLGMHERLQGIVTHLGRLRYWTRMPYETLATVVSGEARLAEVDWKQVADDLVRYRDVVHRQSPESAIQRLEVALSHSDEQPSLLMVLADHYAAAGCPEEAARTLRRLRQIEPDDPAPLDALGRALMTLGQLHEAIEVLHEQVESGLDVGTAHNQLGIAYGMQGNLDEAVRQFREAVRFDADSAPAHVNLGIALRRLGRSADAMRHFAEALRLDPGDAVARKHLDSLKSSR